MAKYIVFSSYYKHGETSVNQFSEEDLRHELISQIVEYITYKPLGLDPSMIYSRSAREVLSPEILEQKKKYISALTLDSLIGLALKAGEKTIEEGMGWGIVGVGKGTLMTGDNKGAGVDRIRGEEEEVEEIDFSEDEAEEDIDEEEEDIDEGEEEDAEEEDEEEKDIEEGEEEDKNTEDQEDISDDLEDE
jgi:hypothetical protein